MDGGCRTSCEVHVVIFQEDHVEQTDTMVTCATNTYRLFLEHTETGSGLAGVENGATRTGNEMLIIMRHRSNTRHPLHDIQHRALYLQQAQHLAINAESDITRLHFCPIFKKQLHTKLRVKIVYHFLRHFHSGKDSLCFYDQLLATHCRLGNAAERCMVAIANVLFEPLSYQLAKFAFCDIFHVKKRFFLKMFAKLLNFSYLCKLFREKLHFFRRKSAFLCIFGSERDYLSKIL